MHTSAHHRLDECTAAVFYTSVLMVDDRHRVSSESNTEHALPQRRWTPNVEEHVDSSWVPRYLDLVLVWSHVNCEHVDR